MSHYMDSEPLRMALSAAVHLRIMELQARGGVSPEDIIACNASAKIIGEKADLLMFPGRKRGETAAVFNVLVNALAVLSFAPGGVDFLGDHWESASFMRELWLDWTKKRAVVEEDK